MLVPAALYKDEIIKNFKKRYYTEDMMYETGCLEQWYPNIKDMPSEGEFDYAIVCCDKLIGYLSYKVDYYCSKVYNFGLMSFESGNPIIGRDLFNKMEELVHRFHRIEWRMVGGNPVEKHYDKFCERYNAESPAFPFVASAAACMAENPAPWLSSRRNRTSPVRTATDQRSSPLHNG